MLFIIFNTYDFLMILNYLYFNTQVIIHIIQVSHGNTKNG